jgi:predicted membrane protein
MMRGISLILAVALNALMFYWLSAYTYNLFLLFLPSLLILIVGAVFKYLSGSKNRIAKKIGLGIFVGTLVTILVGGALVITLVHDFRGID